MESMVGGLFKIRWQPQLQLVRCKTKLNITKPRPPHFQRALVEKLCLPYFSVNKKPKHIPDFESCVGPPVRKSFINENHPLLKILAEESINNFTKSKLIAFFHMNALTPQEKFEAALFLKKKGMKLLFLSSVALKVALTGTIFENVLSFYKAPTATAFCPESDIYNLMSFHKKIPKLCLMAAIVENRLLSLTELKTYGTFKDITEARLHLISVLNSGSNHLVQQINCQTTNLVGLLNQRKKLLEDGNG